MILLTRNLFLGQVLTLMADFETFKDETISQLMISKELNGKRSFGKSVNLTILE